jgi:adenine-specific DNA-methyltransferase
MLAGDSTEWRKQRGAFFTPYAIAEHLAEWALRGAGNEGTVLDPTCGEGVFLLAAAAELAQRGREGTLYGVDLHGASLKETDRLLGAEGAGERRLLVGDFFKEPTPDQLGARIPLVDAIIGNPPFVRYHEHKGDARRVASAAALAQGVRLSGLSSSWAPLLVHASAFLKPDGRIAMVLPAELLSVGYAEPIRQWLKRRFASVHLVLFNKLQFEDAEAQVVLLVARGSGGCNAFTLHHVNDAEDLSSLHIYDAEAFAPQDTGKWTDLLVPDHARGLLRRVLGAGFTPLQQHGTVELGTVTGANSYFALSEATRKDYNLVEGKHVTRVAPPGTRHLRGLMFSEGHWQQQRLEGARVWLLDPKVDRVTGGGLDRYLTLGEELRIPDAYKCTVRTPWWRPPVVDAPDFFFTYMSHVTPRLIRNGAGCTLVNSMHGVRLHTLDELPRDALPLAALNTVTMLSAEVHGRSYGGGILKMEPREAAGLPVPDGVALAEAWRTLEPQRAQLDEATGQGRWAEVAQKVDEALLTGPGRMTTAELASLRAALKRLRQRRQGQVDAP